MDFSRKLDLTPEVTVKTICPINLTIGKMVPIKTTKVIKTLRFLEGKGGFPAVYTFLNDPEKHIQLAIISKRYRRSMRTGKECRYEVYLSYRNRVVSAEGLNRLQVVVTACEIGARQLIAFCNGDFGAIRQPLSGSPICMAENQSIPASGGTINMMENETASNASGGSINMKENQDNYEKRQALLAGAQGSFERRRKLSIGVHNCTGATRMTAPGRAVRSHACATLNKFALPSGGNLVMGAGKVREAQNRYYSDTYEEFDYHNRADPVWDQPGQAPRVRYGSGSRRLATLGTEFTTTRDAGGQFQFTTAEAIVEHLKKVLSPMGVPQSDAIEDKPRVIHKVPLPRPRPTWHQTKYIRAMPRSCWPRRTHYEALQYSLSFGEKAEEIYLREVVSDDHTPEEMCAILTGYERELSLECVVRLEQFAIKKITDPVRALHGYMHTLRVSDCASPMPEVFASWLVIRARKELDLDQEPELDFEWCFAG